MQNSSIVLRKKIRRKIRVLSCMPQGGGALRGASCSVTRGWPRSVGGLVFVGEGGQSGLYFKLQRRGWDVFDQASVKLN